MIVFRQCFFLLPEGGSHLVDSFFMVFDDLFLLPQVVLFYCCGFFNCLAILYLLFQLVLIGSEFADFCLHLVDLGFWFVEL